jgi:hypothetical protein
VIAKNYQEVYQAVIAIYQQLYDLGVRELRTFGNVTRPAESFAEAVILERSNDRVAQLTKDQPEQASAFLTILGDIRAELSLECAESDCKMTDIPKINNLSAEAVIYAIKARRTRR